MADRMLWKKTCIIGAIGFVAAPVFALTQRDPKFTDYSVPIYPGPVGRLNLQSPQAYNYRTRLKAASIQPINFAGHYQLSEWGCGTDCATGAIIDALTGSVSFLPAVSGSEMDAEIADFRAYLYRSDSSLLVVTGSILPDGSQKGWHYFSFANGNLSEIKFVEWHKKEPQAPALLPAGTSLDSNGCWSISDKQQRLDCYDRINAKKEPVASTSSPSQTYLSVLFGVIMKHLQNQNAVRSSPGSSVIYFALDDNGNLTHQAIYKTSGFPDIDQETLDAVRRSAPFPPPPSDIPHRFFFKRDVESSAKNSVQNSETDRTPQPASNAQGSNSASNCTTLDGHKCNGEETAKKPLTNNTLTTDDLTEIHSTYDKNQARFFRDYAGKKLVVTLPIAQVSEDLLSRGTYNIYLGSRFIGDRKCNIVDKKTIALITDMDKGDIITASGVIKDHTMGAVDLDGCSLVKGTP